MSSKQRLVLAILDFLNTSIQDGTVKQDDKESLEVAIQCIAEAFEVDPADEGQVARLSVKPATLSTIFDVFLKTRDKLASPSGAASTSGSSSAPAVSPLLPSADDKAAAEKLKADGNAKMTAKNFDAAIASYTAAIARDPTNAVFYSNRAAAHSSKGEHADAVFDAEKAIEVDPSFVKAYHRLGHALYSMADFKAAAAAFRRGLALDPSNVALKSGLQNAEARIPAEEAADEEMPPLDPTPTSRSGAGAGNGAGGGGMADMLSGLGLGGAGGGAGGGMPDLAGLMNNPAMMQMAQQMMSNGGLDRLMSNPAVANMMGRVRSGDMPSMAELMADPSLRDLASQYGGGGTGP
ncbi:TPR-like protein [Amylocystis lapponica]|nr:TPR-like protein [Amylocystis lapponica]